MFKVKIYNQEYTFDEKVTILKLIRPEDDKKYIAAKVNNRLRELTYELCYDCEVELLNTCDYDAVKVYEASLRYLIAMAYHNVFPDYKIRISYSISRTLLVSILEPDNKIVNSKHINLIRNQMRHLVSLDLPFQKEIISKEEAKKIYIENNDIDKEAILKYRPEKNCHIYTCGSYKNYMYGYMVPSTGYINKFNLLSYDNQMIVQYPRYEFKGQIPKFKDEPCFCRVLAELGNIIQKDIETIRLICIAGPSSSGKTTFSNRLRIELMSRGIMPLRISLDMYYKPRDICPVDENGKPDFESLYALDLKLFNEHMLALINGDEVSLPKFDFETQKITFGPKVKITPKTPIIIEGIHALNDKLSYAIPKYNKFKIYIAPQFQINLDNHNPISYTDIRLLRRIVRDKETRGTSAEGTLSMWQSVRRGEFKWIYPYQEGCNYIYNSALTYELCVLKKHALPALQEIPQDSPYFILANRLIKFLKHFKDMDEKWVPCNSLLREFIGGSCFKDV